MATCTCGSVSPPQTCLSHPSTARMTLARNVANHTQTSDLVNSRRVTKWSSTHAMGKWSFQVGTSGMAAPLPSGCCTWLCLMWCRRLLLRGHKRRDINLQRLDAHWQHHVHLGLHYL